MESGNIYYSDNNDNNNNNRKRTRSPVPYPQAPPPPSDAAFATAAALVGLGLGGQTAATATTTESTPSSFSFVGGQESTTSAAPPPPPPPLPSTFKVPSPRPPPEPPKTFAERLLIINERNEALNELLKLTSSHETNFSINDDGILQSLSEIFCNIIDWKDDDNDNNIDKNKNNAKFISTKAWIGYTNLKSQKFANHCKFKLSPSGNISLEQTRVLEAIITILRNLAYVSANLRHLAYSTCTLQLLVGCLYENSSDIMVGDDNFLSSSQQKSTLGSRPGYLSLPALYILVNLTPYLDVTGQKLLCDKLFLSTTGIDESQLQQQPLLVPHQHTFGQLSDNKWGFGGLWLSKRLDTKEDVVQDITKDLILDFTKHHLIKVWDIFPALLYSITNSTSPRLVTMVSVDLLIEFINHAKSMVTGINDHDHNIDNDQHSSDDNNSGDGDGDDDDNDNDGTDIPNIRSILKQIPDIVLERLMDLLYVPRLGPDALEYIDPVHNIVTRVTTLKLLMGYDATVDTDVRDRALDVLVALCELDSTNIAKRIGRVTTTTTTTTTTTDGNTNTKQERRLLRPRNRLLDSILPILVTQVGRNEAQQLASQLLKELAKVKTKENRVAIKYIQPKLINLSCNDARIAHLTFNFLIPDNDDDDDNDDSDDDDTSSNNEEEK